MSVTTARPAGQTYELRAMRVRLPVAPMAAGLARRHVRAAVAAWQVPLGEAAVGDVLLIVSELVTNAVAAEPGNTVTLYIALQPAALRIAVFDTSPAEPQLGPPGPLAESGLGLPIVAALAQDLGWHRLPGGKVVHATISTKPPTSPEARR